MLLADSLAEFHVYTLVEISLNWQCRTKSSAAPLTRCSEQRLPSASHPLCAWPALSGSPGTQRCAGDTEVVAPPATARQGLGHDGVLHQHRETFLEPFLLHPHCGRRWPLSPLLAAPHHRRRTLRAWCTTRLKNISWRKKAKVKRVRGHPSPAAVGFGWCPDFSPPVGTGRVTVSLRREQVGHGPHDACGPC
jgi:hypothetical protein